MKEDSAIKGFLEKSVRVIMSKTLNDGTASSMNDPRRIQKVRFSSFPFCGVRWFFDLPRLVTRSTKRDYAFLYFTSVGTTVHEVTQKVITNLLSTTDVLEDVKIYWDWKCADKDCGHVHSLVPESPTECESCGGTKLHRDEHEVKYRGALGHTDTIVSFKLPAHIAATVGHSHASLVMDYKTCTISATETKGKLPYPDNVAQISKYAGVLQRSKKIPPMIGWVLVYMPRDIPFRFAVHGGYVSPELGKELRKDVVGYVEEHHKWSTASGRDRIIELFEERPCQNKNEVPQEFCQCEYLQVCTSGKGFSHLKTVYDKVGSKLPIVKEEKE